MFSIGRFRIAVLGVLCITGWLCGPSAALAQQDGQATYATAEEGAKALLAAAQSKDRAALQKVFGPMLKELCSGDDVQDAADFDEFAKRMAQQCKAAPRGENLAILEIGAEAHAFSIPLVRNKEGRWYFDTVAGKEELENRRIGENELGAIRVCRGYVAAQFEYFSVDRDGDDVLEFAQRFGSTPGKMDGLYWETKADEPLSPLGPAVAAARAEGYMKEAEKSGEPQPYHGYVYKLLTKQGRQAPGGAYDYIINGNMVAGCALLAYPVDWDSSGIMTFMVSSNGKVYQKDLGEKTAELAAKIDSYDLDASWTLVKD